MIGQRTTQRSFFKSVDWILIISYILLVTIGFLNIYSTVHYDYPEVFVWESRACKQLVWIATAIALALIILFVLPPQTYESASIPTYLLMFFLLVLVIFVSNDTKGSHSWFEIGSIKIQPAELSKITTSLMLATAITKLDLHFKKFRDYLIAGIILGAPMLAILGESETGSMLVYVGFLFVLYREGISGWWLTLIGLIIVVFVVTLKFDVYWAIFIVGVLASIFNDFKDRRIGRWCLMYLPSIIVLIAYPIVYNKVCAAHPDSFLHYIKPLYIILVPAAIMTVLYLIRGYRTMNGFRMATAGALIACIVMSFSVQFIFDKVLKEHQQKRIEVLLGELEDPSGWGYNVHQSKIAIGSGGFFGKGYLNGTQSTFGFVPEQSTDFIFCTIGEEGGFLGCAAVILIYAVLIWRIVRGAERSRERFIRVYGYCVASCLFMHLIINVGMTIGLMPVIGIPLPLVSYGGSSLWAFTILIFIFVALDRNEKKYF